MVVAETITDPQHRQRLEQPAGADVAHVEQFFDPTIASVSVLLMGLTIIVMIIVERTLGLTVVTLSLIHI